MEDCDRDKGSSVCQLQDHVNRPQTPRNSQKYDKNSSDQLRNPQVCVSGQSGTDSVGQMQPPDQFSVPSESQMECSGQCFGVSSNQWLYHEQFVDNSTTEKMYLERYMDSVRREQKSHKQQSYERRVVKAEKQKLYEQSKVYASYALQHPGEYPEKPSCQPENSEQCGGYLSYPLQHPGEYPDKFSLLRLDNEDDKDDQLITAEHEQDEMEFPEQLVSDTCQKTTILEGYKDIFNREIRDIAEGPLDQSGVQQYSQFPKDSHHYIDQNYCCVSPAEESIRQEECFLSSRMELELDLERYPGRYAENSTGEHRVFINYIDEPESSLEDSLLKVKNSESGSDSDGSGIDCRRLSDSSHPDSSGSLIGIPKHRSHRLESSRSRLKSSPEHHLETSRDQVSSGEEIRVGDGFGVTQIQLQELGPKLEITGSQDKEICASKISDDKLEAVDIQQQVDSTPRQMPSCSKRSPTQHKKTDSEGKWRLKMKESARRLAEDTSFFEDWSHHIENANHTVEEWLEQMATFDAQMERALRKHDDYGIQFDKLSHMMDQYYTKRQREDLLKDLVKYVAAFGRPVHLQRIERYNAYHYNIPSPYPQLWHGYTRFENGWRISNVLCYNEEEDDIHMRKRRRHTL